MNDQNANRLVDIVHNGQRDSFTLDELVDAAGPAIAAKLLATTHNGVQPYGRQNFVNGHGAALNVPANQHQRHTFTNTGNPVLKAIREHCARQDHRETCRRCGQSGSAQSTSPRTGLCEACTYNHIPQDQRRASSRDATYKLMNLANRLDVAKLNHNHAEAQRLQHEITQLRRTTPGFFECEARRADPSFDQSGTAHTNTSARVTPTPAPGSQEKTTH